MNASTQIAERIEPLDFPQAPRGNVVPLPAQPSGPKQYPLSILKALLAVTREVGAVEKAGYNDFHKYNYQKWEDVLDRMSVILPQHGLLIIQSEVGRSLFEADQLMSITYEFTIMHESGDVWPDRPVWTAVARARDQKGICDDKSANKCHTQAHKYFYLHTFKIKTKEIEDDSDAGENGTSNDKKPPNPNAKTPAGPHTIAPNGHSYASWTDEFLNALRTSQSPDEFLAWRKFNATSIAKIEAGEKAQYERIVTALQAGPTAFGKPKPPNPNAKPAETVKAADPMPSPTDAPDKFIQWLDVELAKVTDPHSFEQIFNDKYAPLVDQLDHLHQEDAFGVFNKHEARLEP